VSHQYVLKEMWSREAVGAPSTETFKARWIEALVSLPW